MQRTEIAPDVHIANAFEDFLVFGEDLLLETMDEVFAPDCGRGELVVGDGYGRSCGRCGLDGCGGLLSGGPRGKSSGVTGNWDGFWVRVGLESPCRRVEEEETGEEEDDDE